MRCHGPWDEAVEECGAFLDPLKEGWKCKACESALMCKPCWEQHQGDCEAFAEQVRKENGE